MVGGLIWALALLAAVGAAPATAEVVLIPVAVVASVSASRAVAAAGAPRARGRRAGTPGRGLAVTAAAGSVGVPLAALAGPAVAVPALVVLVLLVAAAGAGPSSDAATRLSTVVVVAGPALAAMSVVLARHQSASHALALVAATLAFDAGAFMMGNGRTPSGGPVGLASGLVSVAVVAVFVAAVMNPPFSGSRPWLIFAVVGIAAAVGVKLCERAVSRTRVPALRRLDSLMLAAPAWVIALSLLPRR